MRLPNLIAPLTIIAAIVAMPVGVRCAPSEAQQKLAAANNGFAFRLLKEISKEQPGKNIFISPYSAATVLQMVENGAEGQTKQEMQRVLGTTGFSEEVLNAANRDCQRSINNQGTNVVLTTANSIWYRKGIAIKPGFMACNQQFFNATVQDVDFDDPRSVQVIDSWASEKTQGRIKGIADGMINPATELFLANAVYFKGKWLEPFEAKNTKERPFYFRQGRQGKVPMMEQTRTFTYRKGTGYQAVRLPYEGWRLALYLFLPDPNSNPEKLLEIMTGDAWQRVTEPGFSEREGTVVFPKFKIEYGVELKRPLMALGMASCFGKADFSRISDNPLFISAVRQKAFVEVNEEGTEAAAVTGVAMEKLDIATEPPKPFRMIVDRPFLFLIHDAETKMILFIGIIQDPAASI